MLFFLSRPVYVWYHKPCLKKKTKTDNSRAWLTYWLLDCSLDRPIKRMHLRRPAKIKSPRKDAKGFAELLKMKTFVLRLRKPWERRRRDANVWQIGINRWKTGERYCAKLHHSNRNQCLEQEMLIRCLVPVDQGHRAQHMQRFASGSETF